MTRLVLACSVFLLAAPASAGVDGPGTYYVSAKQTAERLGPSSDATVTNTIYRQQKVDVFEVRRGWARVSKFYDGQSEGMSGEVVARWVSVGDLAKVRPADLPQPKIATDPRIQGLPKVGDDGLTERDVRILYEGARHFLETGQCSRVEYGDKDQDATDRYYINCGGPQNLFFTPADLPRS
jgi:hypothetical protein